MSAEESSPGWTGESEMGFEAAVEVAVVGLAEVVDAPCEVDEIYSSGRPGQRLCSPRRTCPAANLKKCLHSKEPLLHCKKEVDRKKVAVSCSWLFAEWNSLCVTNLSLSF